MRKRAGRKEYKEKHILGFPWGKFSIYSFFRGVISVYTHFSGGKTEHMLIFPGRKMSMGKNEYVRETQMSSSRYIIMCFPLPLYFLTNGRVNLVN
jgi:hypothetical protein